MKNLSFTILSILIIQTITFYTLCAQEKEKGKLAEFEEEVEKSSESNNRKSDDLKNYNDNDSYDYDDDCDDDYDDDVNYNVDYDGSDLKCPKIFNPLMIVYILFLSEKEIDSGYTEVGYSDYPYSSNSDGIYDKYSLKKYSLYSTMSYFRESNTLSALNFNARLSPLPAISFELNYSDFTEILKTRYDHLRMYDIFINYNRLKYDNIALWWGLGFKGMMGDRSHGCFGLNLGTNIFLPGIPLSLGINYNIGGFESTNVSDFSSKIRYHRDRFEISIGYRRYAAGQVSINGWTLGFGFYL